MKILVCMSNVPDTTTKIRFGSDNKSIDTAGIQWIINPWDELALTRALEMKEASSGNITEVVVLNVGNKDTEPTIRKALAIGADRGIRINAEPIDSFYVAAQIAEVIKKESFDIILCGIESSDYNGAATGSMIAEFLDYPSVSSVSGINIENGETIINREIDGGTEILSSKLPFVAIVQKGIAIEPRIPSMRGIMQARTKPLAISEPYDIAPLTQIQQFELPGAKPPCKMIDPENAKELISLLHNEAKVL